MRLVLETNIVASAFLWGGAPSRLLDAILDGHADAFSSEVLLDEFAGIIGRRKFDRQLRLANRTATGLVIEYRSICTIVAPAPLRPLAPDPDDDWVIATAVAAGADMIVTGDKPFLAMKAVDGIRIGNAIDALAEISAAVRRS